MLHMTEYTKLKTGEHASEILKFWNTTLVQKIFEAGVVQLLSTVQPVDEIDEFIVGSLVLFLRKH